MTARRILPVAGGLAVVAGVGLVLANRPTAAPAVGPVAEFPTALDLGERRPNEAVSATLVLANAGDQPLVIDQISASCSCAGLEVDDNGKPARLTELTLPPGGRAETSFRLAVNAPPGSPQQVSIRFRTNDPRRLFGQVVATVPRVVGRPSAVPAEVAFGSVPLGRPATATFTIRPNAVPGLRVVRVAGGSPDRVAVVVADGPPEADAVARVRVELPADRPGEFNTEATVELVAADGSPHTVRVPVSGRVRRPVEPAPSHLLLPDGRDRAELVLVGATAEPFQVSVAGVPAGLTVAVEPEPVLADRFQVRLVVRRTDAAARPAGPIRLTVTPPATAAFPLEVPVSCPGRP